MSYDVDAVLRAHPEVARCNSKDGAFDANSNPITIDQAKVDAAAAEIAKEKAAVAYKGERELEYPDLRDQLDMIYHAGQGGDAFQAAIKAVKDKYPKPE